MICSACAVDDGDRGARRAPRRTVGEKKGALSRGVAGSLDDPVRS